MSSDQSENPLRSRVQLLGISHVLTTSAETKEVVEGYVLEKKLGQGTWGTCFCAVNTATNNVVSLRKLSSSFSKKELSSIQAAVPRTNCIESDRFQRSIDENTNPSCGYLPSQFVVGEDLFRLVKRIGPLTIGQSLHCVACAIEGLAEAHRKAIAHGELRPSKIMVDRSGSVKIRDLAIAQVTRMRKRFVANPQSHILSMPKHHLDYLAPEILSGLGKPNFSSDLYSMGCILFFLLKGKPPYARNYASQTIEAHREAAIPRASSRFRGIPTSVDACLQRMLAKLPQDRFADYMQCQEALREIAESLPKERSTKEQWGKIDEIGAAQLATSSSKQRWDSLKRFILSALGITTLAGTAALTLYFFWTLITAKVTNEPSTSSSRAVEIVEPTVEPSGIREVPVAESEDSFLIR